MTTTPYDATNDPTRPDREPAPSLMGLATIVLDLDGYVVQWSSGAAGLFGYSANQILGRDIRELVPHGAPHGTVATAVANAAGGQVRNCVHSITCADGGEREISFRYEPLMGLGMRGSVLVTAARASLPQLAVAGSGAATATERSALLAETITRIGSTLDLKQTACETVEVAVPRFADVVGLYVLEHLIEGDELPDSRFADGSIMVRRLAADVTAASPQGRHVAFMDDEVIFYPADAPYARCVASARPLLLHTLDAQTAERVRQRAAEQGVALPLLDSMSLLLVPMKARGTVLGLMAFARKPERGMPDQQDVALAQEIAARAGVCIDNARLYSQARRTALALRSSLLPTSLTGPPGVEVAHRYLPANGTPQVGGDWYDMITLPGGRVALVIGDAMGHDTMAAAAMVQLRTAARTLAALDLQPTDVLYQLDQIAQELDAAQFATCIYATCDPATGFLAIACAGHIPPVLVHTDGTTEQLELPAGLPLGLGAADFITTELEIPDGSILALFTDGLVENRSQDIDTGVTALRDALAAAGPHHHPEDICDDVLRMLRNRNSSDDTTLLLARLLSAPPG